MIEVPDSKEFMEKKEGVCPIVVLSRYKKMYKITDIAGRGVCNAL
jgi:hypothetical protein